MTQCKNNKSDKSFRQHVISPDTGTTNKSLKINPLVVNNLQHMVNRSNITKIRDKSLHYRE